MAMKNAAQRMLELFAGAETISGTHGTPTLDENGIKWAIKSTAKTVKEAVTLALWIKHLEGKRPLGVIPIRADSKCRWGSIDIDDYEIDPVEVIKKVITGKLPLVPCRSKSGGLHLFMFMAEWTDAKIVQDALRDMAASLGHAGCEIFPKQTKIMPEKGESGNWMVMPYYGDDYSGKIKFQYGIKKTGAEMTLGEFLDIADLSMQTETSLQDLKLQRATKPNSKNGSKSHVNGNGNGSKLPYGNGPPCLQHMAEGGFPEDGRKRAIFHIGIYCKRAFPNDWKDKIAEDNQKWMKPPLPHDEIKSVIKSLDKKDYEYTCREQPMASHCNSVVCRGRKYGVGTGGEYPVIETLNKLNTDPPLWFVDLAGAHMCLKTEELKQYRMFQTKCLEATIPPVLFKLMPDTVWNGIVSEAMQNCGIIEAGPDVGTSAVFHELLEEFLTNRTRGQHKEDLLRGAPWEDEEEGIYYFRIRDLEAFLLRNGSKMPRNEVITRIRDDYGGDKKQHKVKDNINVNVWWVKSEKITKHPTLDLPRHKDDHL